MNSAAPLPPPLDSAPGGLPDLRECMHCGLCLEVCPTYRIARLETDSPRGRLALLRAHAEGRLSAQDLLAPLDRCLSCRACEPACPSRVPYHALLEAHREGRGPAWKRGFLRWLFASRGRLGSLALLLRFLRRCGFLSLAARLGRGRIRAMAGAVPTRPTRFHPRPGTIYPAAPPARGRVALHLGCANAELYGGVLADCVALFTSQGYTVEVPVQPPCCGALHAHSGDLAWGRELAARSAAAFADYDAILVPSAGCAAHLAERVPQTPFHEACSFLAGRGWRGPRQPLRRRVAYDPPCHLEHVLDAAEATRELLAGIPGLDLLPVEGASLCCGAGGVAFLRDPVSADAVTARKIEMLRRSGAEWVVSGNPGCLLRLEDGARRAGWKVEIAHPISLLARAARSS